MERPGATLEFWFEFASTYSYVAAGRIEELARAAAVDVVWRPFLLGPIFERQGWSDSPFNLYPAKGAYMWRDLERLCSRYGLPFKRPSVFPRNTVRAARVALVGADSTWGPAFVRAVFRASFGDDRDVGDPEVLAALLDQQGLSGRDVMAQADSSEWKPRLREQTQRAERLGIFGAPSFVVGSELFWGSDRLEHALELAQTRRPATHPEASR
jgi:2-hydroxychromene-2-carboxylate isomerase